MEGETTRPRPRLEILVLCLIGAIVVYQLMIPPLVGIADNGDFARVIGPFSLGHLPGQDIEGQYFTTKYQFSEDAYWDSGFVTSETLFVWLGRELNGLVSKDGLFDIRIMGLLHTALLLAVVWLLLICSRKLSDLSRAVFIALLVIAVTDVSYVQWLNSFYSEAAGLLFFLATAALTWRLIQREGGYGLLALWAFAALLFVSAKPQYAPLGLLLGAFAFHLRTLNGGLAWKRATFAVGLVLIGWSPVYWKIAPFQEMREMAAYPSVFYGVLPESPDPAHDLRELGLTPELARYTMRSPYPADSGIDTPEFRQAFFERISYSKVLRFYAKHPRRFVGALDREARETLLLRNPSLSNFERSAGRPPYALSGAFTLLGSLHGWAYPKRIAWFALPLALYLFALFFLRRKRSGNNERMEIDLVALLLAMAATEFVVVTLAVGIEDTIKHMFLVDVLVDTSLLVAAVWLGGQVGTYVLRNRNSRQAGQCLSFHAANSLVRP